MLSLLPSFIIMLPGMASRMSSSHRGINRSISFTQPSYVYQSLKFCITRKLCTCKHNEGFLTTEFKKTLIKRSFSERNKKLKIPPAIFRNSVAGAAVKILQKKLIMSAKETSDAIVWIDCEMSGLNISKDTILEIASIITDPNLNVVAQLEPIIIKTPDEILDSMDPWCVQHHGESGLTEGCRKSTITIEEAEDMVLKFLNLHTEPGVCPMAGNSIYMDRIFISKYMPKVFAHLHYRNIDVSTVKELVRRWFTSEYTQSPKKLFKHRTLSDIEESISELKYYRSAVFKSS